MAKRIGFGAALTTLIVFGTRMAHAAPERLGDRYQWVIDQRFSVGAMHSTWAADPDFRIGTDGFALAPSAAFFPLPKLSVGLGVGFGYQRVALNPGGEHFTTKQASISPRVGYVVPLGDHFDFWPQVSFSASKSWASMEALDGLPPNGGPIPPSTLYTVALIAPLLWEPATHFFVGVGPTATYNSYHYDSGFYTNGNHSVIFGLSSTVGGYFSG